jgi:hypothetical protein
MSYYSTAKSHKLFNNLKKLYSEFDLKKESVRHKTYNMKNKNLCEKRVRKLNKIL